MTIQAEIFYVYHSGFVIDTGSNVLIFDYYQDPANVLVKQLGKGKKTWVFSSHNHSDHFNKAIGAWQSKVSQYFLSEDIKLTGGIEKVAPEKRYYLQPYESVNMGGLEVHTYGSTDEGVSFAILVDNWSIFHAGDLNWWHWKGETLSEQQMAKEKFQHEMSRLAGRHFDIAFFPVDARLEEYRSLGAEQFCREVKVGQLVAMHTCGESWKPSAEFPGGGIRVPVWCPDMEGANLVVQKQS